MTLRSIAATWGRLGWLGLALVLVNEARGVLIVVTEDGELALVEARPDAFVERAKVAAIDGLTWNHPALASGILLVRNGREMAAYRLAASGSTA